MKISFISTFLNEEDNIVPFLDSVIKQTKKPDEIILVDGGSTDKTLSIISIFLAERDLASQDKFPASKVIVITKKGNRSVGRNEAIRRANGDVIACSDVGCILDKNWLSKIVDPFNNESVDVVAGYYDALASTPFQKCLTPYVLVMPNRVNPDTFLPATRSIAFKKSAWEKVGGFDEKLANNEDYAFAKKLRVKLLKIVFAKNAIVHWIPRSTLPQAFNMIWRFALGDAEAGIVRPKVILIFIRYLIGFILLAAALFNNSPLLYLFCITLLVGYILWSIKKNYRYVNDPWAFFFLPLLQFTADFAVLDGTLRGLLRPKR